ncbi:MAG: nucleotidyltransferase family protein [Clostridia bacterium]
MPFRKAWAPSFSDWSADFYYALSQHTPKTLHSIADMAEGLENRLFRQAKTIWNLDELVAAISCKRYPYARIRRILLNILLNISQERRQQLSFAEGPAYLRILGFRKEREDCCTASAKALPFRSSRI